MDEDNLIRRYFDRLNLDKDVAQIYLALCKYGEQTLAQLSRNSGVERTRIYRMMETLKKSNLVELDVANKRGKLRAAPISNVELLINKQEQNVALLKNELPLVEKLLGDDTMRSSTTKVQFYEDMDSVKQMFWNQTKAQTEVLAIMSENMQSITKASYFERWVLRCNQNNIHHRGIINDHFIATQQNWYGKKQNERLKNWSARYVADYQFPITAHRLIIYDDTVSYQDWKDGKPFGIEITNAGISQMHRQFFNILWSASKPVDDLIGISDPRKS